MKIVLPDHLSECTLEMPGVWLGHVNWWQLMKTDDCVAILSHLKNAGLEADRKEAKQRYTDNMLAYTITLLGRPLEKLHVTSFTFSFTLWGKRRVYV